MLASFLGCTFLLNTLTDLFQGLLLAVGVCFKFLNFAHKFVDLCFLLLFKSLLQFNFFLTKLKDKTQCFSKSIFNDFTSSIFFS